MLTESKYILDFNQNENKISRNADCLSGGNNLEIFISNLRDDVIVGVDLLLVPYVPHQFYGEPELLKPLRFFEDFENFQNSPGIELQLNVVPEYSYLISGSFRTKFGSLTPSKNVSVAGEFENMMKKVGCSIKNNYHFANQTKNTTEVESMVKCASDCHKNPGCQDAWSYELSSKRCHLYLGKLNIQKLQPRSEILEVERTFGWATGLKSCSEQGDLIPKFFHFFIIIFIKYRH